jgi:hypothetical protein
VSENSAEQNISMKWQETRIGLNKSEGKRPLWRPGLRWDDNIKMDPTEMMGGGDSCGSGPGQVAAPGVEPSDSMEGGELLH